MFKKMLTIILSAVISLSSLAGCGASGGEEENVSETEAVNDNELPSGDISLRVWGSEEDEDLINQIISSFVSEYSSQANFNITFEAHSEANAKDDILGALTEDGFDDLGSDPSLDEGFTGELKTEAEYKFKMNQQMLDYTSKTRESLLKRLEQTIELL